MAYAIARSRKAGTRYTGMYLDPDGTYKSAGTFDTPERAQEIAGQNERHHRLQLAETSPADKATITIEDFGVKFLKEHAVEPNSKMAYAQLLNCHIYPYIGQRRVAEISRETIHRLLTVVLPEAGASRRTAINTRTCLSAMLRMAWDHGYRSDNPVQGIRLKHPPAKPIVVATPGQFQRVYRVLPSQPARVLARLGVSTGARYCELISFVPEDFDFATDMVSVTSRRSRSPRISTPTGSGSSPGTTPRTASTGASRSTTASLSWCRSTSRTTASSPGNLSFQSACSLRQWCPAASA
jgi:hypothetical protein